MNKLIAIEGRDHIGKSSIINNVAGYINVIHRKSVSVIHFPIDSEGKIKDYLNNGNIKPFEASLLFAEDRHINRQVILDSINNYDITILDRYVLSNVLYQCGRLYNKTRDPQLTFELSKEILNLEFNKNKLPKPDKTIFIRRDAIVDNSSNDDVLESDIMLQNFVYDNCDNIFFDKSNFGDFEILDGDYLDNNEIEDILTGGILNGN